MGRVADIGKDELVESQYQILRISPCDRDGHIRRLATVRHSTNVRPQPDKNNFYDQITQNNIFPRKHFWKKLYRKEEIHPDTHNHNCHWGGFFETNTHRYDHHRCGCQTRPAPPSGQDFTRIVHSEKDPFLVQGVEIETRPADPQPSRFRPSTPHGTHQDSETPTISATTTIPTGITTWTPIGRSAI